MLQIFARKINLVLSLLVFCILCKLELIVAVNFHNNLAGLSYYIISVSNAVLLQENSLKQHSPIELRENILNMKIKQLEEKLETFEARVPKKYPEVKNLNYLTRKRILVRHFL